MKPELTEVPLEIQRRLDIIERVRACQGDTRIGELRNYYRALQDLVDDWHRKKDEIEELKQEILDLEKDSIE